MIYVIYFFAVGFLLIAGAMYFAWYRSRHFGLLMMATIYASTGLLAFALPHWWPLVLGFILVWLLRVMGFEPKMEESKEQGGETGGGEKTPE